LRRPNLSESAPKNGLAPAQQTIITEHTAAAVVEGIAKRAFRNGGPQSPVKVIMGPASPPWAKKISHVLRKAKMRLNPAASWPSEVFFCA
jgi:hypothetical protein